MPNVLISSGKRDPLTFSNKSAGPPALVTRSAISVISSSGSTSALMRLSQPRLLELGGKRLHVLRSHDASSIDPRSVAQVCNLWFSPVENRCHSGSRDSLRQSAAPRPRTYVGPTAGGHPCRILRAIPQRLWHRFSTAVNNTGYKPVPQFRDRFYADFVGPAKREMHMAWWERDYDRPAYQSPAAPRWMPRRPPTASLVLVVIHVVAFAAMLVARLDSSGVPLTYARLGAPPNHWPSILLHPLTTWGISIIFVVYVVWVLGGKIERQFGPRRMVRLYVLGNLFAGAAYFLMAPVLGLRELHPLSMPAGAMAAWCLLAWREFRHEMVAVVRPADDRRQPRGD